MANRKIVVAIPHSHAWFWVQTCLMSLRVNPPMADGYDVDVVVVDNSPWSPAIRGVTDTRLGEDIASSRVIVVPNHKTNKFHASALDCVVDKFDFDYLMALETDVVVMRPGWMRWFVDQMRATDFAVGAWHHERFINPSCTLYRGVVLRDMLNWCERRAPQDEMRWGPDFSKSAPLIDSIEPPTSKTVRDLKSWIAGPFAEKRGWPHGTILQETPSGQIKGPGHYEPGQMLHHWAVESDHTYTICSTTTGGVVGAPPQTLYGVGIPDPGKQLSVEELLRTNCYTAHMWGGTRALDILKHPVDCPTMKVNAPKSLEREARFWRCIVPKDLQEQTLKLIRKHGWITTSLRAGHVNKEDIEAQEYVRQCYRAGGVEW